ncbi:hypothetical protein [Kitasatospora cineracea]|nr:hypothetical protein [Kitasatospora cineracea]
MTTPAQPSQFPDPRKRSRTGPGERELAGTASDARERAGTGSGTGAPRRRAVGLPAVGLPAAAVLLAAAFFLAPPLLVPGGFGDFPHGFLTYWSSGRRAFSPGLQHLVDRQFHDHLVRVLIAVPLLAVLVALAKRFRRFRLLSGALALVAAALLIENVQGVVSPFGTLLPLLAPGLAKPDRVALLAQVRDQLGHGQVSPALRVMLDEYVRWHMVKAVLCGLLAGALLGLSVAVWRRRHRWYCLLTALSAAAALVVVAANVTTVADPDPGLLSLLQGDW